MSRPPCWNSAWPVVPPCWPEVSPRPDYSRPACGNGCPSASAMACCEIRKTCVALVIVVRQDDRPSTSGIRLVGHQVAEPGPAAGVIDLAVVESRADPPAEAVDEDAIAPGAVRTSPLVGRDRRARGRRSSGHSCGSLSSLPLMQRPLPDQQVVQRRIQGPRPEDDADVGSRLRRSGRRPSWHSP